MSIFVTEIPPRTITLPNDAGSVVIRKLSGVQWRSCQELPEAEYRLRLLVLGIVSWTVAKPLSADTIADLDDDTADAIAREIQVFAKPSTARTWALIDQIEAEPAA